MRLAIVLCALLAGCRGDPPAPNVDAAVAPLPPPGSGPAPVVSGSAAPSASASAPPAVVDAGDPGTLEQTRDKPSASGAAFDTRMAAIWDAIAHDDPDRGMPFFFPVTAYEQVKALTNPSSDWRRRLVANYKRDIHALHTRVGDDAKFVRVEVPDERARWVDPAKRATSWLLARVWYTHRLLLDGKERTFDVSSLISWRGEWYVVHLTGFK